MMVIVSKSNKVLFKDVSAGKCFKDEDNGAIAIFMKAKSHNTEVNAVRLDNGQVWHFDEFNRVIEVNPQPIVQMGE